MKRLKELADKIPYSMKHARAETGEDLPPQIQIPAAGAGGSMAGDGSAAERGSCRQKPVLENRDAFLKEWEQTDAASGHAKL